MAAFGVWEVKFPSSRAVYDEDDEEDNDESSALEEYSKNLSFLSAATKNSQKPTVSECPLLIVGLGEVATTFLEAHFLSTGSKIVACITTEEENGIDFEKLSSTSKSPESVCLYQLTTSDQDNSIICQCRTPVPEEKAFHWTEKLIQNLKPSRVVILTSAPVCEYHTRDPGNITSDFVKVLKTKAWQEKFSQKECSYLETPNIIKGQAASVLQYCQIHSVAAALFVCYTESSHLDSRSVEAFKFLLKMSPLNSLPQASCEEVRKVLKSLRSGKLIELNMYM